MKQKNKTDTKRFDARTTDVNRHSHCSALSCNVAIVFFCVLKQQQHLLDLLTVSLILKVFHSK